MSDPEVTQDAQDTTDEDYSYLKDEDNPVPYKGHPADDADCEFDG